jgi:hypothetical protein
MASPALRRREPLPQRCVGVAKTRYLRIIPEIARPYYELRLADRAVMDWTRG